MKKVFFILLFVGINFSVKSQDVLLQNSTDYIMIQKNGETGFSRAFGLNNLNRLYIGSVEKTIDNIYFYNKGTGIMATFTPNGNFGIGTSNPVEKLQLKDGNLSVLNGDISFNNSSLDQSNNGTLRWNEYANNNTLAGAFIKYDGLANHLQIFTNTEISDFEHLRIKRGGDFLINPLNINSINVGIGLLNPTVKLEMNGEAIIRPNNLRNNHIRVSSLADNHTNLRFFTFGNEKWNFYSDMNDFTFQKAGSSPLNVMKLKANGNVGIGVLNPTEKLTVDGMVFCEEVKVVSDVTADYVFQKYYTGKSMLKADYQMPTLEEVEAYTKKNHHLPEVPSAQDIKENGLHLKEMTNLLLQKIEELTLYTIEQEKRIKALESQLNKKQ